MPRPRNPRPPRDEHAPTSFTPDIDIWSYAIQDLDAAKTAEAKQKFLALYQRGASPKEAAYAASVSYRQVIIWQFEDTWFRSQTDQIASDRRAHPELAMVIFLDHLANTYDEYGAAEAAGLPLDEFKALRKADPVFKRAWKEAYRAAVSKVKANLFDQAQHGKNFLNIIGVLNHLDKDFKEDANQGKLGPGAITINVNVAIDPNRQPRRLPLQSGEEIALPPGDEVVDGDD